MGKGNVGGTLHRRKRAEKRVTPKNRTVPSCEVKNQLKRRKGRTGGQVTRRGTEDGKWRQGPGFQSESSGKGLYRQVHEDLQKARDLYRWKSQKALHKIKNQSLRERHCSHLN